MLFYARSVLLNQYIMKIHSHTIRVPLSPLECYRRLCGGKPYSFLFESAEPDMLTGRHSLIGFDPEVIYSFPGASAQNPFTAMQNALDMRSCAADPSLGRFQAGFVGYFGYETVRHIERLKLPSDPDAPESIFFLPKKFICFDHEKGTVTCRARSARELAVLVSQLKRAASEEPPAATAREEDFRTVPDETLFKEKILRAKRRIEAGDIFQIVLSQKFEMRSALSPVEIYSRMRLRNPSPYLYLINFADFSLVGSSPETLVRTEGSDVILRPIAGTRRRGKNEKEDRQLEAELKSDAKELAEHRMLVDLGRNDLGKIAVPGSVRINTLLETKKYRSVMHLVSELRATRRPSARLIDIFKAAFPAGTLTGAPKVRAMELIAEIEGEPRGIYGGAIGYMDISGEMDFAIGIRTLVYRNGRLTLRAGAGIVYDSKPEFEYTESLNKAAGPLAALQI